MFLKLHNITDPDRESEMIINHDSIFVIYNYTKSDGSETVQIVLNGGLRYEIKETIGEIFDLTIFNNKIKDFIFLNAMPADKTEKKKYICFNKNNIGVILKSDAKYKNNLFDIYDKTMGYRYVLVSEYSEVDDIYREILRQ